MRRRESCKRVFIDEAEIIIRLLNSVSSQDTGQIIFLVDELELRIVGVRSVSARILALWKRLLCDERFLLMQESCNLISLIQSSWPWVRSRQQTLLLPAIAISYRKSRNSHYHFIITEILGECYKSESAFKVVCDLNSTCRPNLRRYLPHALEHLARSAIRTQTRNNALSLIKTLVRDSSKLVRHEAKLALRRLNEFVN